MKDRDVDEQLRQHLSGDQAREAFKQQTLRDSTVALVRVRRQRSALRKAELAAVAVLIAGVAFLSGRLSAPQSLPRSIDVPPLTAAEFDGVTVPSDLIAWLDAARLFRQLAMEDRMARAVERAASLLPVDTVAASSVTGQTFAASSDWIAEDQSKHISLAGRPLPQESVESISGIIAQSVGGYYHANKMD